MLHVSYYYAFKIYNFNNNSTCMKHVASISLPNKNLVHTWQQMSVCTILSPTLHKDVTLVRVPSSCVGVTSTCPGAYNLTFSMHQRCLLSYYVHACPMNIVTRTAQTQKDAIWMYAWYERLNKSKCGNLAFCSGKVDRLTVHELASFKSCFQSIQ